MYIKRYHTLSLLVVGGVLLLLSACSQISLGNGGSSLTLAQVSQNSVNAMKQLKSTHIELQSTSSVQTNNTNASTPSGSGTPTNFAASLRGSGDMILPDQEQLKLTVNNHANVAEVVQGNKIYVQSTQGKWYLLDKNKYQSLFGNPFAGVDLDQNSLLALIQHATLADHGTETLNGQQLRHISADLDKDALRQLFESNPQLKSLLNQQTADDILNRTKAFKSSLNVWIDETQFYIHRTELKLNLTADTTGAEGSVPSSITTNLDTIIDLSKFNDPVAITPPGRATPTDNPISIFDTQP